MKTKLILRTDLCPGDIRLFLARTAFVRRNNFSNKDMVKRQDDLLFVDCIDQYGGRLVDFLGIPEIMNRIKISCGQRRGTGRRRDWRRLVARRSDNWGMKSVEFSLAFVIFTLCRYRFAIRHYASDSLATEPINGLYVAFGKRIQIWPFL